MTDERWDQLFNDFELRLTEEEMLKGWHFCPEYDGLLAVVKEEPGCECQWVDYEYA